MAYLEETRSRSAAEPIVPKQIKRRFSHFALEQWVPLLIVAATLLGWELCVYHGWVSALFFPAPSTIAQTLVKQIVNGKVVKDSMATLLRLMSGLLIGGTAGFLLGIGMGWSRSLQRMVDPFIAATHPLPKISLLPLVMIIFGIGEASKIVLVALAAFFPLLLNSMTAVQQINPIYFEVAQNYGATSSQIFWRVILPASLPLTLNGVRLAFNNAFVVTITVELLSAKNGLGATIWLAWQTLHTEELYVALVITALVGILFNCFLQFLHQRIVRWQVEL